ncbi:MAG TPA: COX15/CtaA family protein [Chitinophagales bacterium]|nr:COX15/CtaA family protein [Chitinophagales bacterium]
MAPVARKLVGAWLVVGCLMIFVQVILGGITRLTESGLSITQWKPINGIIPPRNETEWQAEFDLYKQKVQYKVINEGMTLEEFKGIYFWEYFHRLWGRSIGVVFLIPFIYFLIKKYLPFKLIVYLIIAFLMGGLQGVVGWIMVKAGLTGVFVPPLSLSIHLTLALILYAYNVWLALWVLRGPGNYFISGKKLKGFGLAILILLFLQVFLGGLLSGTHAGLAYPTWPDMNGQAIPAALFSEHASWAGFLAYIPQDLWVRTMVQFLHRFTAYTLIILIGVFFYKSRHITTDRVFKTGLTLFPFFVLLQATIGIITVLNCVGKLPVTWGVIHQCGAMLLIAETVFVIFHLYSKADKQPA